MGIPTNQTNINRIAEAWHSHINAIKLRCEDVVNNLGAEYVVRLYQQIRDSQQFFDAVDANTEIVLLDIADRLTQNYGYPAASTYSANYTALHNTKLPSLYAQIETNQALILDAGTLDSASGSIIYGNLTAGQRTAILNSVNSVLAEYD